MNILDEDISVMQAQVLRSWGIRVRQIGRDAGRSGMSDEEIIPLLHHLPHSTFSRATPDFLAPVAATTSTILCGYWLVSTKWRALFGASSAIRQSIRRRNGWAK
jgi:hypothetical protein